MECLNCGAPVLENGHCSGCGMNHRLLEKAYNTSNFYYNLGLDRACVRDLTGAIDALNLALKYNKQNINARNLIGLIHYEMGEIVLGLTHWVVSANYLPDEQNIAHKYIHEVQADPIKLEEANQLAKQFNQSLAYAKQGTRDLAFIQLKRILSNYPHFVKGYLLLALLYIESGNLDKAKKALKRVLRIDKNNTMAIRYLSEIGTSSNDILGVREKPERVDMNAIFDDGDQFKTDLEVFVEKSLANIDNPDNVNATEYERVTHNKFNLLYVLIGVFLGVLVFWVLILPTKLNKAIQENRNEQLEYNEELAGKNITISDLEKQVSDLQKQIDDKAKAEEEDAKKVAESKDTYGLIKSTIPKTVYKTMCEEAAKAIEEGQYQKAIDYCNVALEMSEGDDAYYYLGKAFTGNHDEEKAKSAFQNIKDNYPESSHLEEINDYLSE